MARALGSVPGSLLGVSLPQHLRTMCGSGVNDFIKCAVGMLLIIIPALLMFQGQIEAHLAKRQPTLKSFVGMSFMTVLKPDN